MNPIPIFRALFTALQPRPQAYTTIVYPVRGQAVVIRDDLNIRHERSWYQVGETFRAALYESDLKVSNATITEPQVVKDSSTAIGDFDSAMLSGSEIEAFDHALINPANGLPVLDGCIDIMGNPMGMDSFGDCWSDYSGFSSFDFG